MKTLEKPTPSSQKRERSSKPPKPNRSARERASVDVKLLLVSFRNGEAVHRHPALQPWLESGWQVRSAVPRIVESGATKLLVILERPVKDEKTPRPPIQRIQPQHA